MNGIFAALINTISSHLSTFIIFEARFASCFAVVFFLRREWVSGKIMIILSLTLAFLMLSSAHRLPLLAVDSPFDLAISLATQCFLGMTTALIINFFVEFFIGFSQIVSMQAGLSFVNFFVPKVGSITAMSHFFVLMATGIFLSLNGHLILIKMLIDSFVVLPTITMEFDVSVLKKIIDFSGELVKGIMMLSFAVIFSIMLTNITLAVLTKFSPQLNLFSIGINISLIVSFLILYLSFDILVENGNILFNDLILFLGKTLL